MSDLIITEKENIVRVADAVRAKTGLTKDLTFEELEDAISNIVTSNVFLKKLCEGTLTEIKPEDLQGITTLRNTAFSYISTLSKVHLPEGITNIPFLAFEECLLQEVIVPSTVTELGGYCFGSYTFDNYLTITFLSFNPPAIKNAYELPMYEPGINKIIVPKGRSSAYKAATNWAVYAGKIEEAVE